MYPLFLHSFYSDVSFLYPFFVVLLSGVATLFGARCDYSQRLFLIGITNLKMSQLFNVLLFDSMLYNWGTLLVAQLVEALRYKPEGRGFDFRRCHWNFSMALPFRPHYGPGVDSAPNRNEYQEYFLGGKGGRCVGLTTLAPSCADCLEIWNPQPPGTLRSCPGL